jgi:hypothetical protein
MPKDGGAVIVFHSVLKAEFSRGYLQEQAMEFAVPDDVDNLHDLYEFIF